MSGDGPKLSAAEVRARLREHFREQINSVIDWDYLVQAAQNGVCEGGKRYVFLGRKERLTPSGVGYGAEYSEPACPTCGGSGHLADPARPEVAPVDCPDCGGHGNPEMFADDCFAEALNQLAAEHGGVIEDGTEDSADQYFVTVCPDCMGEGCP